MTVMHQTVIEADDDCLPVVPAAELDEPDPSRRWLVEGLWARAGVGIIGGAPKSCKSWLALDLALSVASRTPCLGAFSVADPGGVLIYMAEDAAVVVKERLSGLCRRRGLELTSVPIGVITAPSLRLDCARDQRRLDETVARHAPRLLLLDPFVRLHRINENDAGEVSTQTQVKRETSAVGLPKPATIYVYDFAVDPSDVKLDPGGPLARFRDRLTGGGGGNQDQQVIDLGHQVADSLTTALVEKVTAMGIPAQRLSRGQTPPASGAAVAGQFVDLDEGNKVRRMAIGFHQGQSSVSAQLQFYDVRPNNAGRQLLDFAATAESRPLPGAAVTMGAGAAVQVAAAGAAKEMGSSVQSDAGRLADNIANSLQTFFAKQGWTEAPSPIQMP